MKVSLRVALAAGAFLALCRGAHAAPPRLPSIAGERRLNSIPAAILRGSPILPNAFVQSDEAGRLRSLELDDLTPFRLRLTIPF